MKTVFGELNLERYPLSSQRELRAWDAADEYLLASLSDIPLSQQRILIINDAFGALALSLAKYQPVSQTDSYISRLSTEKNAQKNGVTVGAMMSVLEPHQTPYDLVLIKIPKTLALLEEQLTRLRPFIYPATQIMGAGMVKHIHRSTLKHFEQIIGNTRTSLAKKKARLIHSEFNPSLVVPPTPYPSDYLLDGTSFRITNHANVFCRDKLDMGTRFFLQHLPQSGDFKHIVDLGCGNGVVGLMAAQAYPDAVIHFMDESDMAVRSAEATFTDSGLQNTARFVQQDGLLGVKNSVDLVLCNPPFHQQHVVGDAMAWRLFKQSHQALQSKGELWIVGNRHLGYHVKLKTLFGRVTQVAANAKFVVLCAVKT